MSKFIMKSSAVIEELLGAHELCRRIGFLPDDIFVNVQENDIAVLLRGDEDRQWLIYVGQINHQSLKHFQQEWTAAAEAWNNTMANGERQRIYATTMAYSNWRTLLTDMHNAGFQPKGGWSEGFAALSAIVSAWEWPKNISQIKRKN